MKKTIIILLVMLLTMSTFQSALAAPAKSRDPYIEISKVDRNHTVTVKGYNFPDDEKFIVTMNYYGTEGIAGIVVDEFNSKDGGKIKATFDIPVTFKNLDRIAIRMETNSSDYVVYNWFWNFDYPVWNDKDDDDNDNDGDVGLPRWGRVPTFTITSVDRNDSVTIKGYNFTRRDTYTVYMNYYGTLGKWGIEVDTQWVGKDGRFTATYKIPWELRGLERIAIRLESENTSYYSYNWFWNHTTWW
jgi:hypothetical protein